MRRIGLPEIVREARPSWVIAAIIVALLIGVIAAGALNGTLGEVIAGVTVGAVMLLIVFSLAALAYANRVFRGW